MTPLNITRLKAFVGNNNVANFEKYFDGQLWYKVSYSTQTEGETLIFPVPTSDIGSATFHAQEKALLLMRYIRKHLEEIENARQEATK